MMKFALYEYIPQRFLSRATFEQQDVSRMIIGFKDGRNVYSRWAAREFARALAAVDLKDVVVVCIPASTRAAHVRRWKRFSSELCRLTGATDGFDRIQVSGSRKRAHVTGDYELATNIKHYVHIDNDYFRGKRYLYHGPVIGHVHQRNASCWCRRADGTVPWQDKTVPQSG